MSRRYAIFTLGTHGDVRPFVALGQALQATGGKVSIISNVHHQPFVSENQLDFHPISTDLNNILQTPMGRAWVTSGRNPLRAYRLMRYLTGPLLDQMLHEAWQACQGADVLLCTHQSFAGHSIAEGLRIPFYLVSLHPLHRTRVFPSIFLPQAVQFGGHYNWLTHRLAEWLAWLPLRQRVNRWRRKELSLAEYPCSGPFALSYQEMVPHIYGFSRYIVPPPPDWPDWVHVTGFWFLPERSKLEPSPNLRSFLSAGATPLLVSFGSAVTQTKMPAIYNIVREAVAATGMRAVVIADNGHEETADSRILTISHTPFSWLLPHVWGAIIHGGAGTVAACLRAGVPMVTIPFMGTQFFWSERVAAVGAGPPPIPQRALTTGRLVQAIQALREIQDKGDIKRLSREICSESSVMQAVRIVGN